ncbi:sigma-70 family RNA polymerase sigma factor [Aureimonas leprariae]|uniref:Sigma-70 family RNA polymerase sigma factor n=1 Tax=Plantimonas leprariae TaxID=2615207 RepID=A0A7V7PSX2_9HYPH|nr:sigma-70 family RNA polymerase sigma factor [Aureimonas leprariae]KAB0682764.1 sigma-70 family RNA polymerase sigma factor [Aureimonas leprariae]
MTDWKTRDVEEALPALRRYARALTRDPGAADDLVQDTLLRAYERARTFRSDRSLKAWLLSILHNCFVDNERRQAVERRHRDDPARVDALAAAAPADPEYRLYLRQVAERFAELPVEQRSVLHLVAVEGMSYHEAAEAFRLPVGTIMSRLSRARERLRRAEEGVPHGSPLRIIGGRDER